MRLAERDFRPPDLLTDEEIADLFGENLSEEEIADVFGGEGQ